MRDNDTAEQLGNMPSWLENQKNTHPIQTDNLRTVDIVTFNAGIPHCLRPLQQTRH